MTLATLTERWTGAKAAERANAQSYLIELCQALGVEPPRPAGSGYEFEFPVRVVNRDGTETTNFIDLYRVCASGRRLAVRKGALIGPAFVPG